MTATPGCPSTATGIAAAVRRGERSAREVVEDARARAERTAALNAFVSTDWDAALTRADAIDRRRAAGEPLGPLAGVPVSVKDVIAVAGMTVTMGSRAFARHVADTTASSVRALLDADAVVIGKTNCPEFAFGYTCESPLLGATLHPFAPGRSPGGSSGGEAVAVATGVSALGVGTDYGGSLRWPAASTGVVALRPTLGRIAGDGQPPGLGGAVTGPIVPSPVRMQNRFQVIGPLARSVDDLALALGVMEAASGRGFEVPPRRAAPPRHRTLDDTPGRVPDPGPSRLRIGWTAASSLAPVRAETADALRVAAAGLDGAEADEAAVDLTEALAAYNGLREIDPLTDHLRAIAGRDADVAPASLAYLRATLGAAPAELERRWARALLARHEALRVFDDLDVLLLPVAGGPACLADGTTDVDGTTVGGWDLMSHCRAVTLLGAPSVSVPIGVTTEGLPLSVQVVAAPWREADALAVARLLHRPFAPPAPAPVPVDPDVP